MFSTKISFTIFIYQQLEGKSSNYNGPGREAQSDNAFSIRVFFYTFVKIERLFVCRVDA